nr:SDR family oxidoreductase [Ktedonobacteraceae bacterium]
MDLGLKGKKALVTGATRGIGRAIAETFADEGADIAICARHQEQVNETVEALKHKGVQVIGGTVDVADGPALKAWIADVGQALGGIDMLVSNPSAFARQNTDQDWESSFQIDLMGAVRSVEAAKPFLERAAQDSGDAAIVIIASAFAAEVHMAPPYGALKSALIHFVKGIARQEASKRIRVNAVSPGTVYFKGGIWNSIEEHMPARFEEFMKRNPTGRMATPQEIANAVVFLASPASSFTTGINMLVDGAYTVRVNF